MADWCNPITQSVTLVAMPRTRSAKVTRSSFIAHLCNDIGPWGAGFTAAVSNRWLQPSIVYHHFHMLNVVGEPTMELGTIQFVKVEDDIWAINQIGQCGVGGGNRHMPYHHRFSMRLFSRAYVMLHEWLQPTTLWFTFCVLVVTWRVEAGGPD
jgi:hypothetical protein